MCCIKQSIDDLAFAAEVLRTESRAVAAVVESLNDDFSKAVSQIVSCGSAVVVSGIGKSGIIGRKISATLSSLGSPSHFVHPTESMHGDFGSIQQKDVLLLLSFSGQTDEIVTLAATARQHSIPIISITGTEKSRLAHLADIRLTVGDVTEACPLNLAPTASTTAMLALGDALALCVSRNRQYTIENFRSRHPHGGLGKLMLTLGEVVRFRVGKNLPVASDSLTVAAVLEQFAQCQRRVGATLLVNEDGALTGIFTDADLRRLISRAGPDSLATPIKDHMTRAPKVLSNNDTVRDAVQVMIERRIDEIPLVDENGLPSGLIDVQDLIALGVMSDDHMGVL